MFSELKKIEDKKLWKKNKTEFSVSTVKSPTPQIQNKTHEEKNNKENDKKLNNTSNITILQLSDKEIDELRDPTNDSQTFRLTEKDKEWIKDTAYFLSKEIKRGSVSQTDILRLSFLLFEKLLKTNRVGIIKIIERIK